MTGRQRPLGRRPTARSELVRAREELERAGGRFADPRFWLTLYQWREAPLVAARYSRARGPLVGPGTAIVRAVDEHEVEAKLRADLLPLGLELIGVIFAAPWAAGALLVQ